MSGRGRGSKTTAISTRSSLKIEGTSALSSVPTRGCLVQLTEEDSRALAEMKNIAEGRLQDYKSRLEGVRKQVDDQVRELHRAEDAQSSNTLAIKLQTEIDCMQDPVARQRLIDLIGQFLSTTRENLAKLEANVARAKALLAKVETNIAQESEHFKFCVSMERTSHNMEANLMKPFPPVDFEQSISEVALNGFYHCAGCGFLFDARILDVFSLPCTHVYHMLCFAHVCRDYGYCVALDCNMSVPPRAKHMIGLKVKSEIKESSTGTDIAAETCIQESLRTTTERVSVQATEQSSHACSNKTMHSTRKSGLITPRMRSAPGMEPALEAESTIGNEVCGVVEDILMAKSSAVKSPRQQLTPRRLLRSPLSAKASPSVDTRDEALDEAIADASYPVKNPRGDATASRGVTGKKKESFDTVDHCTPTSTAEFVPNVPNAVDVQVVHDDVHTDVDLGKLEKGTLPTPTAVESGIDAIVDAMVVDACTDAIVDAMVVDACIDAIIDATVVDACTNDIVDAMEVDASTDSVAADGNVDDGGTESIVHAVIDGILEAVVAMGTDATVESGTDAILDASTDSAAEGNVNDGGTESIAHNVIDAILDAVVAMGTDATIESGTDAIVDAMVVDACTDAMADATVVDAYRNDTMDAMEVDASTHAAAEVVSPSDAADDIVDAAEVKGTDAVVEDMKEENTHNTTEACTEQNNEVGKGTEVPTNRAAQSGEAMGEHFMAAVDTKEVVTHDTTESCTDPIVGNTKGKSLEVPCGRAAATDTDEAGTKNADKEAKNGHEDERQERVKCLVVMPIQIVALPPVTCEEKKRRDNLCIILGMGFS
ncbi:hypothetical protein L7F22_035058 [Adiantum nelumboides]|nr:hypothetical protein [Adiantum nelumboides]